MSVERQRRSLSALLITKGNGEELRIRVERVLAELRRTHEASMRQLADTQRTIAKTEAAIKQLEAELEQLKSH